MLGCRMHSYLQVDLLGALERVARDAGVKMLAPGVTVILSPVAPEQGINRLERERELRREGGKIPSCIC